MAEACGLTYSRVGRCAKCLGRVRYDSTARVTHGTAITLAYTKTDLRAMPTPQGFHTATFYLHHGVVQASVCNGCIQPVITLIREVAQELLLDLERVDRRRDLDDIGKEQLKESPRLKRLTLIGWETQLALALSQQ